MGDVGDLDSIEDLNEYILNFMLVTESNPFIAERYLRDANWDFEEPVDEERSRLVDNFVQITGSDAVKARDFLEWCMWDIGIAVERYRARLDEVGEQPGNTDDEPSDSDMSELMPEEQAAPTDPEQNKAKEEKFRFSTIADLEASESSDDEDNQAYYAGGSEHSGQQVLGPPAKKRKEDIIADILRSVQQAGAETVDPTKPSTSSTPRESFSGTGYRLGQSESDTQVVPSTSRSCEDESHATLKLWKEGFNVNDGPLREYDDPENKQFLDSVRQGLIPPELTSNNGNATVQLNLEDHHHESFTSFRAPRIRPFTGQGHVLGRPTPALIRTNTEEGEQPQGDTGVNTTFKLDESKPMTTIAIRFPDGRRLNGVFNHSHTVGDIRAFIRQTHPEFGEIDYSLQTTIPVQELKDNSVTVAKAGLINSVLIMRLQK